MAQRKHRNNKSTNSRRKEKIIGIRIDDLERDSKEVEKLRKIKGYDGLDWDIRTPAKVSVWIYTQNKASIARLRHKYKKRCTLLYGPAT